MNTTYLTRFSSIMCALVLVCSSLRATDIPGTGLTGQYFNGTALGTTAQLLRTDAGISFDWGDMSPGTSIKADKFSVRWIGWITVPTSGSWTLTTLSDDGVFVRIGDALAISDWSDHSIRETSSADLPLIAGERYPIEICYYENTGQSVMKLYWAGPGVAKTIVPKDNLYPYAGPDITIPTSSRISPVCIEGSAIGTVSAQVNAINTRSNPISDTTFYLNAPLSATATTSVAIKSQGVTKNGTIAWTPTILSGDLQVTLRKGDSLLLKGQVQGTWSVTQGSGIYKPETAVAAGQTIPFAFTKAGTFRIITLDAARNDISHIDVTVASVTFPVPIACEVGFGRTVVIPVAPKPEIVSITSNDMTSMTTAVSGSNATSTSLTITPRRRGTPKIVGRILGNHGPIISMRTVDEFTIDVSGAANLMIHPVERMGIGRVVMRPYIPNLNVKLSMFAHSATFVGGSKDLFASTSSDFIQAIDTATNNEVVGAFFYDIFLPVGENSFCHTTTFYQPTSGGVAALVASPGGSTGDPASKPKPINGSGCTCLITFPCACTEQLKDLKVTLSGTGNDQWNLFLVGCPDPGDASDTRPVFDGKGGVRKKGPIPCDGMERTFPVWTGKFVNLFDQTLTLGHSFKVFLERNGECFECDEFCVFPRKGRVVNIVSDKNGGFTSPAVDGVLPTSPYRTPAQISQKENIPGGVGGYLLWKTTDDCGNIASLWSHKHNFKFMVEGEMGNGKIHECVYPGGINDWEYAASRCGTKTNFTVRFVYFSSTNQDPVPNADGFYQYRYYHFDACDGKLTVNKNSTKLGPLEFKVLNAQAAVGGVNYSGPPFGVNANVQP